MLKRYILIRVLLGIKNLRSTKITLILVENLCNSGILADLKFSNCEECTAQERRLNPKKRFDLKGSFGNGNELRWQQLAFISAIAKLRYAELVSEAQDELNQGYPSGIPYTGLQS